MNTEQLRAELLPCPFCGGSVSFHQDDEECRDGCHYIECKECGLFDLSATADPNNQIESLSDLRDRIAPLWNRRAALQSQDRDDGFSDGVLLALQMMTCAGYAGSHLHFELIETAGLEKIVRRALQEGMWELAGLDAPMSQSAREAIDHARRAEGGGE